MLESKITFLDKSTGSYTPEGQLSLVYHNFIENKVILFKFRQTKTEVKKIQAPAGSLQPLKFKSKLKKFKFKLYTKY